MKTGWWLGHPSEKYEFVNWDVDIPNISGKIKDGIQTANQFHDISRDLSNHATLHPALGGPATVHARPASTSLRSLDQTMV